MSEVEAHQRPREWLHQLRLPPGTWTVVRVDGRGFSKLTEGRGFSKPFDPLFSAYMVRTAEALLRELDGAVLAYTESDEISVVLPPSFSMFNRSVEKVLSISAGVASSVFSHRSHGGVEGHFDARVWLGSSVEDVVDYLSWRQSDAARCCLNGYAYWLLRQDGLTARAATAQLNQAKRGLKHDVLHDHGHNFNELPAWQRRGIGLWWETYAHVGVDPRDGKTVPTTRRMVRVDRQLPRGEAFRVLVRDVLAPVDGPSSG